MIPALAKLVGTMASYFNIGGWSGVRLKNSSGNLVVRNGSDSADVAITVSTLNVSGNAVTINSDAAGSGADWTYTLQRPSSGMGAAVTLTLPVDDGTSGQVLSTDGNGVLSWVSAGSTTQCLTADVTNLAYNSSSTVSMFTLPANAVVYRARVLVDTAFNASAPTMSIGISGNASKYMGSTDVDLKTAASYEVEPGVAPSGSTEAIEIAFAASSGGSAGAARVEIWYAVPN